MTDTDPLVPALADLVVDLSWFLDSCEDDEVDPDSAVKMLESERFLRILGELAEAETDLGRRAYLTSFPFACGLVEAPEG